MSDGAIAYRAETRIDVPPDVVWAALMDTASWPTWATFHPEPLGPISAGERVIVRFAVRGLRIPGRARFVAVEPEASLWWRGGLGSLLVVEHGFDLKADGAGTLLHHEERFSGPLAPLVVRILGKGNGERYRLVNEALKARLESESASATG